jgi:hypothetical protein
MLPRAPSLFIRQHKKVYSLMYFRVMLVTQFLYWFARLYALANGYWGFIMCCGRATGNWLAVFYFPPASYTIRNFGKPIALLATRFHVGFLLGLFFDPEDGGDMFLRDVGWISAGTRRYIPEDRTLIATAVRTSNPTRHSQMTLLPFPWYYERYLTGK